ncbi:uncharacterized protein SAPINGB_P001459 [Magnusiomyces paraingens]|uniref:RNase T2-like C-terminal domain-containing protein n=1 Tax=Magnusiomyces paraingens TaxID=2606893 RepID=A0A5E8B7Y5_9ASCO|nr:uncharacterized protein SAPINGB_P001459 [Saprochaete ingens]VVT46932.1 unnamed protein product [Saprochaete ingens]
MRSTTTVAALAALSATEASFTSNLKNMFSLSSSEEQQQLLGAIDLASEDPAYKRLHCPGNSPFSCSIPAAADSCCYEATNGVFVASQKWESGVGPFNLFTNNGLSAHKCSGGASQYCDSSREIGNATEVLETLGYKSLIAELARSWSTDEEAWTHAYNKHATCMATLNSNCYGEFERENQNVADYFTASVNLQRRLPTYYFLQRAGIVPSSTEKVSKDAVLAALKGFGYGHDVYLKCENGALSEVRYYFTVRGSVSAGRFVAIDADKASDCPAEFWYSPKETVAEPSEGEEELLNLAATPDAFPGAPEAPGLAPTGHLITDMMPGCLDNNGTWFVGGLCGNFTKTLLPSGNITLTTLTGNCALNDTGFFSCGPQNIEATSFNFTTFGFFFKELGFVSGYYDEFWSAVDKPSSGKKALVPPTSQQISVGANSSGTINFRLKYVPQKLASLDA